MMTAQYQQCEHSFDNRHNKQNDIQLKYKSVSMHTAGFYFKYKQY